MDGVNEPSFLYRLPSCSSSFFAVSLHDLHLVRGEIEHVVVCKGVEPQPHVSKRM